MTDSLKAALATATRFNGPDRPGFRRVGFILPDEIAWPEHNTAYDVPQAIYDMIRTPDPRIIELEGEVERLRAERDALLQQPIDLAKMDSIDEGEVSDRMVAYYWHRQALEARAALNPKTTEGERSS